MARTGDECHGGDAGVWPVDMSVGAERSPLKRVRGAVRHLHHASSSRGPDHDGRLIPQMVQQ